MMTRIVLAIAVAAFGVTAVVAQSDLLSSTALMREQAQATYNVLNKMVKGEIPYEQAKVDDAVAKLVATAARIPQAFPASIKGKTSANTRYSASPKVWDNRADFEEYASNLSKAIVDLRGKAKSLDDLKAAYPALNDACNGCHQDYRLRRS